MVARLGLNKDTINTAIGTLVQKGVIRREGNKQTGHWEVVKYFSERRDVPSRRQFQNPALATCRGFVL